MMTGTSKLIAVSVCAAAAAYAARATVRRRRCIHFTGKTVLIAGASRALGLELARAFGDEAALRNNEASASRQENRQNSPHVARDTRKSCACTHPTHFLGRCGSAVEPPEETCPACMESHFHLLDDPTI